MTETTWSANYAKLAAMATGTTATILISGAVMSTITSGAYTFIARGTISRSTSTVYDLFISHSSDQAMTIRLASPSSSSPGTVTIIPIATSSDLTAVQNSQYSQITNLYSGDDLNDIHGDGVNHIYYIGNGVTNSPINYATMYVISREGSSGLCTQLVIGTNMYFRIYSGNPAAWSAWKQLATV